MKELWIETTTPTSKTNPMEHIDAIIKDNKAYFLSTNQTCDILTPNNQTEFEKNNAKILRITIKDKTSEDLIVRAAQTGADYLIVGTENWRIIPLENLIARIKGTSKLIAEVTNAQEAKIAIETLELGTDGVLLKTSDTEELIKTLAIVKPDTLKLQMTTAKIVATKPISTGARVCVDTCDLMTQGEGILVGSQSAGLFLVEAEVNENPYVNSRPFRVNAGSCSMYTLGNLQTTRYLQEFKAGDEVIIINREGQTRRANVGRIKIEIRPLILIEAQTQDKTIKVILQNAETIRVVTPKGSKPVTELKTDDEVVVHLAAKGGRHFGISVPDETVIEK